MSKGIVRNTMRLNREKETLRSLEEMVAKLNEEGYEVEFGEIGKRTTYALLQKSDEEDTEIVGYTYIKDLKYKIDIVGKMKALQQALARKSILEGEVDVETVD